MPGWTSAYKWKGRVPPQALPWTEDPASGYIVTANQAVVDGSYPYLITDDWEYGTRSEQISSMIQKKLAGGLGRISPEDMLSMQQDDTSVFARTLVPYLLKIKLKDPYFIQAQNLLKDWDFQQDSDSAAAAYYNAVWDQLLKLAFDQKFPAALRATSDCIMVVPEGTAAVPADDVNGKPKREKVCGLRDGSNAQPDGGDRWTAVVAQLLKDPNNDWWSWTNSLGDTYHGRDSVLAQALVEGRKLLTSLMGKDISGWSWGRVHTLELKERTIGSDDSSVFSGIGHTLLNRGPYALSGGTAAVDAESWNAAQGFQVDEAPSMRMVVDLSDLDKSHWINIGGASGHAYAAHYNDQTPLWASGQTLPWAYSRAAVAAATKDKLTLSP
jgi:penicillin amidase